MGCPTVTKAAFFVFISTLATLWCSQLVECFCPPLKHNTNRALEPVICAGALFRNGEEERPKEGVRNSIWESMNAPVEAAYVHLPFCRRRCYYCDFPIKVVGDRPGAAEIQYTPYLEILKKEIRMTKDSSCFGKDKCPGPSPGGLRSVYFGGGTPSLVAPEALKGVLRTLEECYGLATDAEITLEADPGTFDVARIKAYLDIGVNRLSLGVQSFDPAMLAAAGRAHTAADTDRALAALREVGFENFGVDLICGLPHQTAEVWRGTLERAVAARPQHISVYDLQVEEGTAFGRWYAPGRAPLPGEGAAADLWRAAGRRLGQAGYVHYELSNFALPGCRSRHNSAYWDGRPYLAFGNAAASYLGGQRLSRPRGLAEYGAWVEAFAQEGWDSAAAILADNNKDDGGYEEKNEKESRIEDYVLDTIMVGLRLKEGISMRLIREFYGNEKAESILNAVLAFEKVDDNDDDSDDIGEKQQQHSSSLAIANNDGGKSERGNTGSHFEKLCYFDKEQDRLVLTDPEGLLMSNQIISTIFSLLM